MTAVNQTPQTSDLSTMGLAQYDNACIIGKILEGKLFQGESFVIEKLKGANYVG